MDGMADTVGLEPTALIGMGVRVPPDALREVLDT